MIGRATITVTNRVLVAVSNRTRLRRDTTAAGGQYLLEVRRSRNRWVCVSMLPGDLRNARRIQKAVDDAIEDAVRQALGRKR